jgi:MFS family permease
VAPIIVASISDATGRRPAYLVCFLIYIAANLGLSLQNSYAALLVLRCLQSAGSSGTVALANGIVGDLATSSERGIYIAFASMGAILGPIIAPIIGGILSQYLEWHWLFWFLLIVAVSFAVPFLLFFPETCRAIVGNGSVPPPLLNSCLTDVFRRRKLAKTNQSAEKLGRHKMQMPNPLKSLLGVVNVETCLILLPAGLASGVLQAVLTDASKEFVEKYHFNNIKVSFMFVPIGVGGMLAVFTVGKLVDFNFRRHAKRLDITIVPNRKNDLSDFPVERARLELTIPIFVLLSAFVIIYGWIMTRHVSVAGPVIVLFALGYAMIAAYQILSVLLVDIHPGKAATASAANNLMRCEIGAAFAAIISPMINSIGTGWSYTIMALLSVITVPGLLVTIRYGMQWRKKAVKRTATEVEANARTEAAQVESGGSNNV